MSTDALAPIANTAALLAPTRLWSRAEVFASPAPIPREPGVYAWHFRELPPGTPADGCGQVDDRSLLCVGIAPKAPPNNGARPSKQFLVDRVRYHYRGNAEDSTLRLGLGRLIAERLGVPLGDVASGKRMTFGAAEAAARRSGPGGLPGAIDA